MKYFWILFIGIGASAADFDVLLYNNAPNPQGIPTNWPARVEVPAGRPSPWILMSGVQLEIQKSNAFPAYLLWQTNFELTNRVASARERLKARLTNDLEFRATFTALARLLVAEINPLRTTPTNVFSARTEAQALNALFNNSVAVLDELITTNTPPP